MSFYSYRAKQADGREKSMADYQGQVILVVNTASQCGLASQLEGLQKLYEKYQDQGFTVLAFPSNQFAGQEPGSDEQIKEVCRLNFGVEFPLFAKVKVNGPNTHPLFKYLKKEKGGILSSRIKWNYTKFLIDRNGRVVKRYAPSTQPEKLEEDIKNLID